MSNNKRVTLNRINSSLLLDYQAIVSNKEEQQTTSANEYTRQLVASALSLPAATSVQISTTVNDKQRPKETVEKRIDLPTVLLKSSLRSASAPCSPTNGLKSVQFSKHNLEEICLFRKAQTPLAISQKNIFWGDDDDEDEESSSCSSDEDDYNMEETKPIKSLVYANWPTRLSDIIDRKQKVIRVEKNTIALSSDFTTIGGKILVKNLDYQKAVTIRYTFDFWETVLNKKAKYSQQLNDHDVFTFSIEVPPNAITLYFAVNYMTGNNQEFWDNNDGRNYEIQIKTTTPAAQPKKVNDEIKTITNTSSRYDFSQAKTTTTTAVNTSPPRIISTKPTLVSTSALLSSSFNNNNNTQPLPSSPIAISTNSSMPIPIRRPRSSSPSCHSPLNSSPSFMDLNSQSYMELVNKYCFYSTSPSRSPMSING